METCTLKISDLKILDKIRETLQAKKSLNAKQQDFLCLFLSQLPPAHSLDQQFENDVISIQLFDLKGFKTELDKWFRLFKKLPGKPIASNWKGIDYELADSKAIAVVDFEPTFNHFDNYLDSFQLYLNADGTARFDRDAFFDFPDLAHFNGSWKEAYLMIVSLMQKGWPQERFPEELEKLLAK